MKLNAKIIAEARMQILIKNAMFNSRTFPKLAQRQAYLARKISTRYRLTMPYELRITYCKKCKNFIAPGINSKIRIGRTNLKAIRISCSFCGNTYRKVIAQ